MKFIFQVTGIMIQEQLLGSLKYYTERGSYIELCLKSLFNRTFEYNSPKADIIKVIKFI